MKEKIEYHGEILAIILRARYNPAKTKFITPKTFKQQVGFIVYNKNKDIGPHIHRESSRKIKGTSEVLILKKGLVRVDFYSKRKKYIGSRKLFTGDILILVSGGHGFHFYKNSTFIEIKQGPYIGSKEKEIFRSGRKEKTK